MNTDFAIVLHFHQPVGNFDHVIERACDKCYMPLLSALKKYPSVKMSLHFSGCLLEWFEKNRPEMMGIIGEAARSGQIEIVGGAFYEPILSSISRRDGIRQIKMLAEYVEKNFSFKPKGAWIAERVWEAALPSLLREAGVKYVILDDTHFLYSGILKDKTYGYYITEDNAKSVAVFPSDKKLRYGIPFEPASESINYMRDVSSKQSSPLFVYADDGEKFGQWPGTYEWVFTHGWLEKFLDELVKNEDWLNTVTLSESLKKRAPLGRVYLPASSYEEMCNWALPASQQIRMEEVLKDMRSSGKEEFYKPFIRGGFWRNFLSKYPESNHMHKKMMFVSGKLMELSKKKDSGNILTLAEKNLFRGQCNCAYWHGIFGGIYLYQLRGTVFQHLIESEVLMDKALYGGKQFQTVRVFDFDNNGFDEVIMENRKTALYFSPSEGGILKELDSKLLCRNLISSLARREESYHKKILDECDTPAPDKGPAARTIHDDVREADSGIKDHLNYDRYGRYSLVDHFFYSDINMKNFADSRYEEAGDFISAPYDFKVEELRNKTLLTMTRAAGAGKGNLSVQKKIIFQKNEAEFTAKYKIENSGEEFIDLVFAPEFNLTMPHADADKYSIALNKEKKRYSLKDKIDEENVKDVTFRDKNMTMVTMSFSAACRLWSFPVKTVSQSEKTYELNYQSTAILPRIMLALKKGERAELNISVKIDR